MSSNSSFWSTFWRSSDLQQAEKSQAPEPEQQQEQEEQATLEQNDLTESSVPVKRKASRNNNTRSVVLRHKHSTSSLASMTAGNWLGWNSKKDYATKELSSPDEDEDPVGEDEDYPDEGDNDDITPDDNGDEVDDHVSKKKPSSWAFWSSNSNNTTNVEPSSSSVSENKSNQPTSPPNEKKESVEDQDKSKIGHVANTIVKSTQLIPSKQELTGKSPEDSGDVDDAVLYKPHNKPTQFDQINTHKNENLRENIIVPDWNTCLPHASTNHIFYNSSTSNQGNTNQTLRTDIKNWRQFLTQISSKFGFSSAPIISEPEQQLPLPESTIDNKVERDIELLYEKSYKLYGKSLAILPEDKRGCLPNYNKYYHNVDKSIPSTNPAASPSQLEEDQSDPNSISITNDAMGNLLINNFNNTKHRALHQTTNAEVVSHKSGPLKKIKNILIIGVHGFFPTRMIRPIIGAPKGTSLKFANEAEKAIIRYCLENELITEEESKVSIQKIALEKEGKIFDRVDFFTEILQKWEKELNNADFIFIASHSQGCVVSIILLARLIKMGVLKDPMHKRIGILGMAGVNNGPFYGVDKSFFMKAYSAIEHESMNELFELNKFDSQQSLAYKESIQTIINVNVKICFIASINDQLVPLFSALASHVFHPNIYRACYIDSTSQTPKFVEKLVSLCSHLINVGFFDNNVIKELSTSLAGPFTGNGHSKIYNDGKVYDLGIKFVLDTDDIVIPFDEENTLNSSNDFNGQVLPVSNQVYIKEFNIAKIGTNPYILPWCLRGLLFNIEKNWPNRNYTQYEDKYGLKNGYEEIHELYEIFEHWKPETKVYKDLKFRLNGLRASKL
ncbi:hypothetical protein G210_3754 [Candida maltosa Xu316]|uniref:YMC020W-like alpha/beta hydrolase domain-containing protein n=1 Tax=Candida maltosa (strain Xu316) TaxID=1245528 RepID=M3II57_CANMX|nr:hypothetical protein G210_3754 [Candida maltosa Xu316]